MANATDRNDAHHAEAIEIIFDPTGTSELLEFFFRVHDPTTLDCQGNDQGARDRSAIFYTSDEQKDGGLRTRSPTSSLWSGKVVSEGMPASDFREAEPEHQDDLEWIGHTCHFVRPGWKLP